MHAALLAAARGCFAACGARDQRAARCFARLRRTWNGTSQPPRRIMTQKGHSDLGRASSSPAWGAGGSGAASAIVI